METLATIIGAIGIILGIIGFFGAIFFLHAIIDWLRDG